MSLEIASRAMPSEFEIFGGALPPSFTSPALWVGPRLVGLVGAAGAGKSTAASYLVGRGFERIRFAGPLKAMMRALGLTEAEVDGDRKEIPSPLLGGRTPRQAMQWLGTEWGRQLVGETLWLDLWSRAHEAAAARGRMVVVDDVRFANEAARVRAAGGLIVRIERAGAGSTSGASHASERLEFEADATIVNDGDLAALERAVDALAEF